LRKNLYGQKWLEKALANLPTNWKKWKVWNLRKRFGSLVSFASGNIMQVRFALSQISMSAEP